MKLLPIVTLGWCLAAAPVAMAGTSEANCKALMGPVNKTSLALSEMYGSMKRLDYNMVANQFSGKEKAQMQKMGKIQDQLLPIFGDYIYELEALGLMMARCSR